MALPSAAATSADRCQVTLWIHLYSSSSELDWLYRFRWRKIFAPVHFVNSIFCLWGPICKIAFNILNPIRCL